MSTRTLWAIRQKSTGLYILDEDSMHRTYAEPSDHPAYVPRLFSRKQSANMSLTAWVKGHASRDIEYADHDGWESTPYAMCVGISYEGIESRKREDMEVVEVTLELP